MSITTGALNDLDFMNQVMYHLDIFSIGAIDRRQDFGIDALNLIEIKVGTPSLNHLCVEMNLRNHPRIRKVLAVGSTSRCTSCMYAWMDGWIERTSL